MKRWYTGWFFAVFLTVMSFISCTGPIEQISGSGNSDVYSKWTTSINLYVLLANWASVKVTLDRESRLYFLVYTNGQQAPSSATVMAGTNGVDHGIMSVPSNQTVYVTNIGLTPETSYVLYMVAIDLNHTNSIPAIPTNFSYTTPAVSVYPVWIPPTEASTIYDTSASVQFTLDRFCVVFYTLYTNGQPAPDKDTLVAMNTGIKKGFKLAVSNETSYVGLTGLEPSKDYVFYMIAGTNTNFFQPSPTNINFTTAAPQDHTPPEWISPYPSLNTKKSKSVIFDTMISEDGKIYFALFDAFVNAPTPEEMQSGSFTDDPITNGEFTVTASNLQKLTLTNLLLSFEYVLYLLAEDSSIHHNPQVDVSSNYFMTLTNTDFTPPVWIGGYPIIGTRTNSYVSVKVKLDEECYVGFRVLEDGYPTNGVTPALLWAIKDDSVLVPANTEEIILFTGLTPSTNFDLLLVAKDLSGAANYSPVKFLDLSTTAGGPPLWVDGYPQETMHNDGMVTYEVKVNKTGKVYWSLYYDGSDSVTNSTDIKNGTGSLQHGYVNVTANTSAFLTVSNLSGDSIYQVYMAAEDSGGLLQFFYDIKVPTCWTDPTDTDPPGWSSGYPVYLTNTVNSMSFNVMIEMEMYGATIYAVAVTNGASAPTSVQVKAGSGVVSAASVFASDGNETNITLTGLVNNDIYDNYDYYLVAEDLAFANNLQSSPVCLSFNPPQWIIQPYVWAISTTTVDFNMKFDDWGTIYMVLLTNGAPTPTPVQVSQGKDSYGNAAPFSDNRLSVGNQSEIMGFTGLTSYTTYRACIVLKGVDAEFLQKSVFTTNFTTD